jgi:hypothetical protein
MKFLECPELNQFNVLFDGYETYSEVILGKLELYSFKKIKEDKQLEKDLKKKFNDKIKEEEESSKTQSIKINSPIEKNVPIMSPKESVLSTTPFGPLTVENSKTLITLISALNAIYQDYDFKHTNDSNFIKLFNLNSILGKINQSLCDVLNLENKNKLWVIKYFKKEYHKHTFRT